MKRWLKRLSAAIGVLLVLLVGGMAFLLSTETGMQLLWPRLAALAGPALAVESVSGRLGGALHLRGVSYRTDSDALRADELWLDWNPRALLRGTLKIQRLGGRGVHYRHTPGAPAADETPLALPEAIRLPVRIVLEELRVETASVALDADSEPLQVTLLRLAANASGSRLRVEHLELDSPDLQLQGSASLEARGAYPLQAGLSVAAVLPDLAPLSLDLKAEGSLREQLVVRLDMPPPYAASAALQLERLLEAPRLGGTLELQGTEPAAINAAWPALQLDAQLRADGTPERLQLQAAADTRGEAFGELQAVLAAVLEPGALQLDSLTLTADEGRRRLQASGRIGLDPAQPVVTLQADWQELAWPLTGTVDYRSAQGRLTVDGSPDTWRIDADAQLDVPAVTTGRIRLTGRGDRESFDAESLLVEALEGRLTGTGRLDWAQGLAARFDVDGRDINPAGLLRDWPGKVDLQLAGNLLVGETDWQVTLDSAVADGTLRGLPLAFSGAGSYRPGRFAVQDARLTSGPSRLAVNGEFGERLDLDWQLDSPDLASLLPGASGSLAGAGQLQGTPSRPRLVATLNGSRLRYAGNRLDAVALDASVDLGGGSESHLELTHSDGLVAGRVLRRLQLQGRGYPQAHRLELQVDAEAGNLSLQLEGNWQEPVWRYRLTGTTLTLADDTLPWQLARPVEGLVSAERQTLPEACWQRDTAVTCLHAAHGAGALEAGFRLEGLRLAELLKLLDAGVGASGTLSGSGSLQLASGKPLQAEASLRTTAGDLVTVGEETERRLLALGAGQADLQIDRRGARLEASLPVEGGGLSLQATVAADAGDWPERALSGSARLQLPDIAFAGQLHPEITRLQGRLEGDVNLSGRLGAPRLLGQLQLTGGEAMLATPGLTLRELTVDIRGEPSGVLRLVAGARSGEGVLSLAGEANVVADVPTATLKLQGENVQVLNTPEADIVASPELELAMAGTRIDLSGKVKVPRALIEPRKLPESAVTVSADQVIVTDSQPLETRRAYQLYSRVRFVLGDAVKFDGLGLKGQLTGNLLTLSEPERPATATGELGIRDGSYRAYGQNLDIRTGRLLFAGGPVTAPGLDVEAVRRPAPDVLVGVRVRGTLREPVFTVFSEPEMAQSRQLSWLVLGRDLETNASDEERSAMNEAALMLGLGGGELLGQRLGEKIGVDEVSIASEPGASTSQASLLVGKYLTPELLVSYGIGLFEPVSTLRLRYTLSSRWKLVGEASAERSSADIFYVIERGE